MAKRSRSPNYPALNLEDAVAGIKKVYVAEGNRRTSGEDVAIALGHQSLSGAARVKVSALRKYGLLEAEGDGLKVSDQALSLINLPSDHPDHTEALKTAALSPVLFEEIHETYGDTSPSDGVLRNYLLKKDFNHKVADDVIRLYRETMELISQQSRHTQVEERSIADLASGIATSQAQDYRGDRVSLAEEERHAADSSSSVSEQQYRIAEDCEVNLTFIGRLTQDAVSTLEEYLDIFKRTLPVHSESLDYSSKGGSEGQAASDMGNEISSN